MCKLATNLNVHFQTDVKVNKCLKEIHKWRKFWHIQVDNQRFEKSVSHYKGRGGSDNTVSDPIEYRLLLAEGSVLTALHMGDNVLSVTNNLITFGSNIHDLGRPD